MELIDQVLVVGGGGREHCIIESLLRSKRPLSIFAFPGNPGMEVDGCTLLEEEFKNWEELAEWAEANGIDLTIVGPEAPLVEGIVDVFQKRGLKVFGPDKSAARIEGSKKFAKELMERHDIPTAEYRSFNEKQDALDYAKDRQGNVVIKVSGLAGGKGAIVCNSYVEAEDALERIFDRREFGDSGENENVLIENKMIGEEASVFVMTDGSDYKILPVSQDHKPVFDDDKGPNTGGMGAYAPAYIIDDKSLEEIEKKIIQPVLKGMKEEGNTYKGLLYVGIMMTENGPKVVEFNCRFGDPETQAVLPLVECDWYNIFKACVEGGLSSVNWHIKNEACACVVLASEGYPGKYRRGSPITGLDEIDENDHGVDVYFAGVDRGEDGRLVTSGGRVLSVSAVAENLETAVQKAYENAEKINYYNKMYRKDIARKGINRLRKGRTN